MPDTTGTIVGTAPPKFNYQLDHLFLSHSSRRLLHSCARKFEFRKFFHHPGRDAGLAAEMGKALHKGLQTFLTTKNEEEAIRDYMFAYPIHLCQNDMDKYSLEAGYNTLMGMINASPLLEYELAKVDCLDSIIRPAVEVPFQIDLLGYKLAQSLPIPVSYIGYIDGIFYNTTDNEFIVLDIKTVGKLDMDISPKFNFSEQCIPYALVLEYMKGAGINGFTIKYLVCKVDVIDPKIQIHEFVKTQEDVEDWFRGLLLDLANIRMFLDMEWFPRTGGGDACFAYNRRCTYYDICQHKDRKQIQEIILMGEGDAGNPMYEKLDQFEDKKQEPFSPWVRFGIPVPEGI